MKQPLKDKNQINAFLNYLKNKNTRDYLLAKIQLNTGLRISDVVDLKCSDVMLDPLTVKEHFEVLEKKTRNKQGAEVKIIMINKTLKSAIRAYVKQKNLHFNDYLFQSAKSKNGYKNISTHRAWEIYREAAIAVGINLSEFATHSLRKTWGYWSYKKSAHNIGLIMSMFGHTSMRDTLRYIGIDQEEKDNLYSLVQF